MLRDKPMHLAEMPDFKGTCKSRVLTYSRDTSSPWGSLRLPRYIRRMLVPSLVQHVIILHVKDIDLFSIEFVLTFIIIFLKYLGVFSKTYQVCFSVWDAILIDFAKTRGRSIALLSNWNVDTTWEYLCSQSYILPLKIQLIWRRWLSSRIMRVHLNKCYHRRISLTSPLFKR